VSEYQYYEFQTIDRPLNAKEQEEIKQLSSRVKLTPNRAIFLYNYGDFSGQPEDLVAKYFDLMFYIANWGSWQLIFRFPKAIVKADLLRVYEIENSITINETSEYVILNLEINQEEGFSGWVEGEGWSSKLLPLRHDLLAGDMRLLYLVWLKVAPELADYTLAEDPIEPPIPADFNNLSPQLQAFIDLVELDPDLVAAAQADLPDRSTAEPSLESYLPLLSASERDDFLLKILRRELHVDLQLIDRLQTLAAKDSKIDRTSLERRHFSQIQASATTIQLAREGQEREAARADRMRVLNALAGKEEQSWRQVINLVDLKQAKAYDEATILLQNLHDLAADRGTLPEFSERFNHLKSTYKTRPALMTRWRSIKV
jgi:hypothetical protein